MILDWLTGPGLKLSRGLEHRSELKTTAWPESRLIIAITLLSNTGQALERQCRAGGWGRSVLLLWVSGLYFCGFFFLL